MSDLIYLDHAATTPLRGEARAAMEPFLASNYGNPSSIYRMAEVERAIRPDTVLVSAMWVNNELGTIQPVAEIAEITRRHGVQLHVDGVQAAETLKIDLGATPIDLMSLSAHKFGGPKGTGVLF